MTGTPVFDEAISRNRFSVLPAEYTDRFTPDVALRQGVAMGMRSELELVLETISREFVKPTKQLQQLRALLEARLERFDA